MEQEDFLPIWVQIIIICFGSKKYMQYDGEDIASF